MKRSTIAVATFAMLALASSSSAHRCACADQMSGMRGYDTATESTVTGTISEVKKTSPSGRGMGGRHLMVETPSGPVEVHVGPDWYVSSQSVAFEKGDALSIVGSRVKMAGSEALIAREIRKGDQVLTLRDANGIPRWSGHRGR